LRPKRPVRLMRLDAQDAIIFFPDVVHAVIHCNNQVPTDISTSYHSSNGCLISVGSESTVLCHSDDLLCSMEIYKVTVHPYIHQYLLEIVFAQIGTDFDC